MQLSLVLEAKSLSLEICHVILSLLISIEILFKSDVLLPSQEESEGSNSFQIVRVTKHELHSRLSVEFVVYGLIVNNQ